MDFFKNVTKLSKIAPNLTDNQQFLDHFNQYVYQEWSSYYFAYDLLKKEYRRIKKAPNACGIFERQLLKEMRRVHGFLLTLLNEAEDDLRIVNDTIEALQVTLSEHTEADLLEMVSISERYEQQRRDSDVHQPTTEPTTNPLLSQSETSGKSPKQIALVFLAKSLNALTHIAHKVETIVHEEDAATRKARQLDHNIELAIRSIYAILARCEQFYKLNNYAIRKIGKRMEKLYRRRPIGELTFDELAPRKRSPSNVSTHSVHSVITPSGRFPDRFKSNRDDVINALLSEEEDADVPVVQRTPLRASRDVIGSARLSEDDSEFTSQRVSAKRSPPQQALLSKKSWQDTPSGIFFYHSFDSLGSEINHLKARCVDLYSIKFKQSAAELAAFELEFVENKDRNYRDTSSFITFKLGFILCVIIWMIADTFSSNSNTDNLDFWNQPAMYVYTTIFNLLLYRLFWGIDIAVWTRYGVNYISVLELRNIKSNLLFVINQTTTLMTLFFISLLIFYRMNGSKETLDNSFVSYGSPLLLLIASIGIQIFQTWFYYSGDSSRGLFNQRVVRNMLTAPWVALSFRDAYGADVLTSFTKVIADSLYASCWVLSGSFLQEDEEQTVAQFGSSVLQCKSDNMIMIVTIMQTIPLIIRFLQCCRGIYESRKVFPFAFNAWKYLLSICVVLFAVEQWADKNTYMLLVVMTTIYKAWWDTAMDWGLLENTTCTKQWYHQKVLLRNSLMYPYPAAYYGCMALNLILRFVWVLSLAPMSYLGDLVGAKLSMFMGTIEIVRRSIWGIFRVEWEHVKSIRNETPGYLPTHVLRKHEWSAKYGTSLKKKASVKVVKEAAGVPKVRSSIWMALDDQDDEGDGEMLTMELPDQAEGLDIT